MNASKETGIPLASYCSVARGKVFEYSLFDAIAKNHNVTAAQVVLRWILQQGVSINAMSTKRENLTANFDVLGFELTEDEMSKISALNATNYRIVNNALVPWAPTWDNPC